MFYLINRFFWLRWWNFSKKDEYILVEYTNNQFMNFAIVLLAKIVSISLNAKLAIFITPAISKPDRISRIIYKSFGVRKMFYMYDFIKIHGRHVLEEFRSSKSIIKNVNDLYEFTYKNVCIGDLLYDTVLRSGKPKATVQNIDEDLDDQLYAAIGAICFIEYLTENFRISCSVFSHPTMHGGIVQRYLFQTYKTLGFIGFIGSSIRKFNYLHENRNPFPAFVQKKIIDQIINNKKLKEKYLILAENYIESKVAGKIKQFDSVSAYAEKSFVHKNKQIFNKTNNLDVNKPNVFFSLHVFNDQPNTTNSPFRDYYTWMNESFEILVNNPNVNLIVKEHPSTKFYPTTDFNFSDFKIKMLKEHKNKLCFISSNDNFSTASIKYVADFVVTAGGSIALEASCWGIPSLICSSSYFSDIEVVNRAKSKKEYFYLLENIHTLKTPDIEIINRAKLVYYISNGVLWDGTWNNAVFFPKMSYEEKSNPNMKKIFLYYMKFLLKKESREYIIQMINFVKNENANIFYRDQELARLEETSLTQSV
jgi:hypothetical protein